MNMGQSLVIKGELAGGEDLTLDGRVEGKVSLPDHVLTVGANATLDGGGRREVRDRARHDQGQRHREGEVRAARRRDRWTAS